MELSLTNIQITFSSSHHRHWTFKLKFFFGLDQAVIVKHIHIVTKWVLFSLAYISVNRLLKRLLDLCQGHSQHSLQTEWMSPYFPHLFASWDPQEANKKKIRLRQLAYKDIPKWRPLRLIDKFSNSQTTRELPPVVWPVCCCQLMASHGAKWFSNGFME